MRAIAFDTEEEANARNRAEAVDRRCGDSLEDVTQYWYAMVEQDGKFYLLIGDDSVEDYVDDIII
jgi:hypothetical protein